MSRLYVFATSLGIGWIFLAAAAYKFYEPARALNFLSFLLADPSSTILQTALAGLIAFELVLGFWLMCGRAQILAMQIASLTLAFFIVLLSIAWTRGYTGDCGCSSTTSSLVIAIYRNMGLLIAVWLASRLGARRLQRLSSRVEVAS